MTLLTATVAASIALVSCGFLSAATGTDAFGKARVSRPLHKADYHVSGSELGDLRSASSIDALEMITRLARRTNVVILNEDHRRPRDRVFASQVAAALAPLGYRVLALETLENFDSDSAVKTKMRDIQRRGYVLSSEGMYTSEPAFGEFVKKAIALGYRLVPYETTGAPVPDIENDIAQRERDQAANLIRRTNIRGGEKVFIYVGLSHVSERPI